MMCNWCNYKANGMLVGITSGVSKRDGLQGLKRWCGALHQCREGEIVGFGDPSMVEIFLHGMNAWCYWFMHSLWELMHGD